MSTASPMACAKASATSLPSTAAAGNCGCNCAFVKSGFCETDKGCPFYLETWWQLGDKPNSTPKLVKDCFPKKFGMQQNQLELRLLTLQASFDQVRTKLILLESAIQKLIMQGEDITLEKLNQEVDSQRNSLKLPAAEMPKQIE